MVATAESFLGIGMYTPAEAAMYARVTTRMMSRWVHGDRTGEAVVKAQVADPEEKTVTFLDFIQTLSVRAIRDQHPQVSLQKIRQAVDFVSTRGATYPFARKHKAFWFDGEIHLDVEKWGLMQASGKQRGQFAMKEIVEVFLEDLTFNEDGLAESYKVYESGDVKIVMRPGYHFGEPVVESSGHTAWTLWQASVSEGSFAAAAKAYGVTENEVRVAFRYIDSIRTVTAA